MDSLDNLTPEQRDTLQTFQAVIHNEDIDTAIATLVAQDWNLERAVASAFGDELPTQREVPEAEVAPPEDLQTQQGHPDLGVRSPRPKMLSVWGLLALPITLPLNIVWVLLSYAASFLPAALRPSLLTPAGPQRTGTQSSDPRADAHRFLLDFEDTYGRQHPEFFQGTYTQALQKTKTEVRYLVVYLHSAEHDDTEEFCRQTLCSEDLISALQRRNVIFWAGDVGTVEGYQVSHILAATTYPFIAVITPNQTRLAVATRLEGPTSPSTIIDALTAVIEITEPHVATLRAERESREQSRSIREQQDEAYQASLRADREKRRKAEEEAERTRLEEEAARKEEEEREAFLERRKRRREELLANLPTEPAADAPNITKLSIRLPSGDRVIRRFDADDLVSKLYEFVETRDLEPLEGEFLVVGTFPREVYDDLEKSLKEVGLVPSASLVVEEA
ncbi:thioredoxin-like protein [Fimicolochytrium jonesii]|uniref:thioredoxin-like protein n=1 Tax=Fimicolochytrium jonesii TaxID=1396493 RepID=UPI0022FED518|nr:thioredoxin-like protein [Fimicolochytrium jonesii]KAI8826020.1 thioredoxin-like protein [Fimicolochytrium jonesii]